MQHVAPRYDPRDPHDPTILAFGQALDALRTEVEADLGTTDRVHLARIRRRSRRLELAGRGLLQFCVEPLGFSAGVACLSVHKCLELMEIGHMALHGAYERISDDDAMRGDRFVWRAPIDEVCWRREHNIRHHQYTNILGRDPDIDFGELRLSPRVAFRRAHRLQPVTNLLTWLGFASVINVHVTGALRPDSSQARALARGPTPRTPKRALLGKAGRYYARELVAYPILAGPFFWKVALGNLLSDVARDLCAGAIIYCGHVGATDYPADTKAGSHGRWYAMQAESASNVEMPRALSILCGALDKQIEHHLFPRLPPNRLREIAPRVRALCAQHGVTYRSAGVLQSLRQVLNQLADLSRASAAHATSPVAVPAPNRRNRVEPIRTEPCRATI